MHTDNIIGVLAEARAQFDEAIIESECAVVSNPSNTGAYRMISENVIGPPAKALRDVRGNRRQMFSDRQVTTQSHRPANKSYSDAAKYS